MGIVLVTVMLWPARSAIKMSFLVVWQEKDGQWWTTMWMTNDADVPLGFEWLESQDRDIGTGSQKPPPPDQAIPAAPNEIDAHSGMTHALKLPPPGTARRFLLRYFPAHEPDSWVYRRFRRFVPRDQRRTRGCIAASPEVSASLSSGTSPHVNK
jgi:hypothetical protein